MLVALIVVALLALLFTWIERRWPAQPGRRWWKRPWRTDALYWTIEPFLSRAAVTVAAILVVLCLAPLAGWTVDGGLAERLAQPSSWVAGWPRFVQVTVALVVADFTGYWVHRANHRVPWLWALHSIHHSSEHLDWFAATRNHPFSQAVNLVAVAVVLLACGFPIGVFAGIAPLLGLIGVLGHANVRWEWGRGWRLLFASPTFHRWHHTQVDEGGDRNFSNLLPIWDRLFGTWYLPTDRRPERFGIAVEPPPAGFLGQLAWPLRAWFRHPATPGWRWRRLMSVAAAGLVLVVGLLAVHGPALARIDRERKAALGAAALATPAAPAR